MDIIKRSFKRNGCKIIQDQPEVELFKCFSDCEIISGKLSISSKLFYLGLVDPGKDFFTVSLRVKRPTRWQDGNSETIAITREFLDFSDIKKWILSLEKIILGAIFPKENADNEAKEAWEGHVIIKMLLDLTKDFAELKSIINEDEKERQRMLDSHQRDKP